MLFNAFSDPALYDFIDDEPPPSVEWLAADYKRRSLGAPADCGEIWFNWAIKLKSSPIFIGRVEATIDSQPQVSIAYIFGKAFWRQGYAKEACVAVIDFLRSTNGINRFRIEIDIYNTASIRLAEALAFQLGGTATASLKGAPSREHIYILD